VDIPMSELRNVLDVRRAIEARCVIGGPSPSEVKKMINLYESKLDILERWVSECRSKLESASNLLREKIDSLKRVKG
ncbi:MAG: hypothetical protein N3F06_04210, partial [Nitrososphaerales archaeon]|nr:hypothetical protein [Nitrososphaerales archaeon]